MCGDVLTKSLTVLCLRPAAEKASIYSYPSAILPVLTPLMKVLAHYFPDKGITTVSPLAHLMPADCIAVTLLHGDCPSIVTMFQLVADVAA